VKILMILREDFPPDVRVLQEASSLIRAGHVVALACFNRKNLPAREIIEGIQVHRLSPWTFPLRKVHTLLNNLPYRNPAWSRFVLGTAKEFDAQVLHVHDLPLVKTVLSVGKTLRIPVIFDMHENWAELLPSVNRRMIEKLIATRYTFKAVEVEVCEESDAVVVVVEESRERLASLGVPQEKIIIAPNVVDLRRIPPSLVDRASEVEGVSFIYAGGISHHRGLDVLIKAWGRFIKEFSHARLIIAGTGPQEAYLSSLAGGLGLTESIDFPGWLSFDAYLERISTCSVGLVPHISTPHTDSTLPHKLFHYMALKKPVIVGDAVPLRRVVEGENCGLVVRSGDVEGMADALAKLAASGELRKQMGQNGRRAVEEKYNWDTGIKPLLEFYDRLGR
jgi:glycosyltransferase involved in cell wall biosynthesis